MSKGWSPREHLAQLRQQLNDALEARDIGAVEQTFRQLLGSLYRQRLSSDELLAVAACMLGTRNYPLAMRAYEEQLAAYPQSGRNPEVHFRLGILFSQRFQDYDEALKHLELAAQHHPRGDRVAQAEEEMGRIQENLARIDAAPTTGPEGSRRAWVVRQTDDPMDIAAVGRLVAREAGLVLAEVTAELRNSRGTILPGAPLEVARRVARALQQVGMPVLVIGEADLVSLPETGEVTALTISGEGVRFELGREVVERSWADVYFVVGGRLQFEEPAFEALHVSESSERMVPRSFRHRAVVLLDFFVLEPWLRLRVEEGQTRLQLRRAGRESRSSNRVDAFLQALVEMAPDLHANDFVRLLAGQARRTEARRFDFDSTRAFDSYCHWLLQLEEHNRPPG